MKNLIVTFKIFIVIFISGCKSIRIKNEIEIEIETETSVTGNSTSNVTPNENSFENETKDSNLIYLPEGYSISSNAKIAYKIYDNNSTWDEARDQCIYDGGDLAIIDTWDKIEYLTDINFGDDDMLHVGFHKPENLKRWMRVDNELPVSWLPWFKKHPPAKSRYCVVALPSMDGLFSVGCWLRAKSVCAISIEENDRFVDSNFSTVLEVPNIPEGYKQFPRFKTAYKIFDDYLTHNEARKRCFTDGGHLAIVDSFEKVRAIAALPKTGSLHVGIRIGSIYFEKWVADSDGGNLEDLPWTPDNPQLAKCAALRADDSGLEETLCSNRLQFICEIGRDNQSLNC